MGENRYDLVVLGATGFTGQFVLEEVARKAEISNLTYAAAARNKTKLEKYIEQSKLNTGLEMSSCQVIIADVNDEESLLAMARQAKVVINCVGPYRFYGERIVAACIEGGANHVDISGEPQYLERMQLEYNDKAKAAGVHVVGACGFDSVPADMGTIFLQDKFTVMDGMDKTEESLLKNTKSDRSVLNNKTEDNLRLRTIKHTNANEKDITPSDMKHEIHEQRKESIHNVWDKFTCWSQIHHSMLPQWLQDNEFMHYWHRPPLQSSSKCFKSIFKLHTETGNIWTHLVGCVLFIVLLIYFILSSPIVLEEKFIASAFFAGAILCLGFSTTFHTLMCHSETVCDSFRKLDYCGISCLIMGSSVPMFYFFFYCDYIPKLIYIGMDVTLGTITIIVSLWDRFGTPEFRTIRSMSFVIFGLSALIPTIHYMLIMDWNKEINTSAVKSTFLLATLYISGAAVYAARIPEKWFPGKCDLWVQSHQIFHILVVAGAYVTYQGLMEMVAHRHTYMECAAVNLTNNV